MAFFAKFDQKPISQVEPRVTLVKSAKTLKIAHKLEHELVKLCKLSISLEKWLVKPRLNLTLESSYFATPCTIDPITK